jgi:hypothetical protein
VTLDAVLVNSGRAIRIDFGEGTPATVQERRSGNGMRAMLESPVREAAVVTVNGRPAGSVWRPPYELDVTGLLRPGENTIRVVATNLAINELAHQALSDYRALIQKYGDRFQDQDMTNLQRHRDCSGLCDWWRSDQRRPNLTQSQRHGTMELLLGSCPSDTQAGSWSN